MVRISALARTTALGGTLPIGRPSGRSERGQLTHRRLDVADVWLGIKLNKTRISDLLLGGP